MYTIHIRGKKASFNLYGCVYETLKTDPVYLFLKVNQLRFALLTLVGPIKQNKIGSSVFAFSNG